MSVKMSIFRPAPEKVLIEDAKAALDTHARDPSARPVVAAFAPATLTLLGGHTDYNEVRVQSLHCTHAAGATEWMEGGRREE